MLNSLINVGLLVMGVGAKASTPINLEETQEQQEIRQVETSQEQTRNGYERSFSQNLEYNIDLAGGTSAFQGDSPAFAPTTNTGPWHYNNYTRKGFVYNTAPYTIQGATQENRIVNGYGTLDSNNRPIIYTYDLSTLNFYDVYILKGTAIRISAENPTISSSIITSNTAYIGYYNYTNSAIGKNIVFKTYAYMGIGDEYEYVFNMIYNNNNMLLDAYNYCNNTPGSFTAIYNEQTILAEFESQTNGVISASVERTYQPSLYTSRMNYLIEFTTFKIVNTSPFVFTDPNFHLTFGSTTPPTQMSLTDLGNLVFIPNVNNPTRFEATYTILTIRNEMVDIPGLVWEILSMPYSFISQAFDLTLFPNTPYAINFANLFLSIFGVLVFIFIFKLILKR